MFLGFIKFLWIQRAHKTRSSFSEKVKKKKKKLIDVEQISHTPVIFVLFKTFFYFYSVSQFKWHFLILFSKRINTTLNKTCYNKWFNSNNNNNNL